MLAAKYLELEDRIVKRFLAERGQVAAKPSRHLPLASDQVQHLSFQLLSKGAVKPSDAEVSENPRSRSARLRAAERTDVPAYVLNPETLGLPKGVTT